MAFKRKFECALAFLQITFIIIFGVVGKYGNDLVPKASEPSNDTLKSKEDNILPKYYPMFQHVNVMLFLGVAFLYAFLGKYGYSGVGMNILMGAIAVQLGIIISIWWKIQDGKLKLDVLSVLKGEFAAAAAVIAYGGVYGKLSKVQIIGYTVLVVIIYTNVSHCCETFLKSYDPAECVALHLFAAVFGCSATFFADRNKDVQNNPNEKPSYNSNLFCLIGTVLLWSIWPSFNASTIEGDSQHRAVLNTYLALVGGLVATFIMSSLLNPNGKFTVSHVQNATLAGGVSISATCTLMIQPYGALLIGFLAAIFSVVGFQYLSPVMSRIKLFDPCGIHSLHGIPGLFGGITSIATALLANEKIYGYSLYQFYPAMAPKADTAAFIEIQKIIPDFKPGDSRSAEIQACYQLLYIVVVIVLAGLGGLMTGWILHLNIFDPLEKDQMFIDETNWLVPDSNENEGKGSELLQGSAKA